MNTIKDTITNDELIEAAARKLAQGAAKARIFDLIDEFASFEHWHRRGAIGRRLLQDIPEGRRLEFIRRLEAL